MEGVGYSLLTDKVNPGIMKGVGEIVNKAKEPEGSTIREGRTKGRLRLEKIAS